MRATYTCLSSERSFGSLFKEVNRLGETMSRRYMPYPVGDVCLDLIVNENDWARILGYHLND